MNGPFHPFRSREVSTRAWRQAERRARLRRWQDRFTGFAFTAALALLLTMVGRIALAWSRGAL